MNVREQSNSLNDSNNNVLVKIYNVLNILTPQIHSHLSDISLIADAHARVVAELRLFINAQKRVESYLNGNCHNDNELMFSIYYGRLADCYELLNDHTGAISSYCKGIELLDIANERYNSEATNFRLGSFHYRLAKVFIKPINTRMQKTH